MSLKLNVQVEKWDDMGTYWDSMTIEFDEESLNLLEEYFDKKKSERVPQDREEVRSE